MAKYIVEELDIECLDPDHVFYDHPCPHGCPQDDCEGHVDDKDRMYFINGLYDRHDGDEAGYFSKERVELIAAFMNAQDPPLAKGAGC